MGLGVAGITVLQLIPRKEGASMTACCCECGDEPWLFINCMDLLQYLSNNQLLTKDFVGTGSLRQTVSPLVQIRTAGLVLAEI